MVSEPVATKTNYAARLWIYWDAIRPLRTLLLAAQIVVSALFIFRFSSAIKISKWLLAVHLALAAAVLCRRHFLSRAVTSKFSQQTSQGG